MIYLVGAGPGDPGLITLRGVECLKRADVVLFDYLVNPSILSHAPQNAEKICLGRHGQGRIWPQEEVNSRMVQLAREGKTVVRLKGGDPAIFARLVDELTELSQAHVAFEVVPGITAALAATSYAGIPLTHRGAASAVALITAQEDQDKTVSTLNYESLAKFSGTLVFYMGVTTAPHWTRRLLQAGKSPQTPVAIVHRCSLPDQQVINCSLADVAKRLAPEQRIRPPVIVVVGEVTNLAPVRSWFDQRPLFGVRVMVTRPADQAAKLRLLLEESGAQVMLQPAIEIRAATDWTSVDRVLDRLDQFDWLVFSSTNGVSHFFARLLERGLDLRAIGPLKIACVGPGTASRLQDFHLHADLQPDQHRAEEFAATLAEHAAGQRFCLVRTNRGRELIPEQLVQAGGVVEQVEAYRSRDVTVADPAVAEALGKGQIDWITVTSSAIARSLVGLFADDLHKARLATISPVTSATLRELGFEPAAEAETYTMQGLVEAILRHNQCRRE